MTDSRFCSQCGAPLTADAPGGVCPQCVLKLGMEGSLPAVSVDSSDLPTSRPTPSAGVDPGPTTPVGLGFIPPSVEELQKHFSNLEIIELLGRGGMGAVYKARQASLDRFVALKILPPEVGRDPAFAERFTREARALAKLSHPNIVMVYDFGQSDGLYYLLMEFVDGVNLRQTIRSGALAPDEALKIVPQICEALQFAHEEGVVHRDIKPENILLDKRGRLKIADFGLAKLLGRADSAVLLTGTFQVMGTLHYMAPEQFERPTAVDHRADIYSLGVVFYELLTGQLPLGRYALPSEKSRIDARLDDVVLKTLEREPDRRYQHASDVKTDIENIARLEHLTKAPAFLSREPAATRMDAGQEPTAKRGVNVPLLILGIIALLAAVMCPASIVMARFSGLGVPFWLMGVLALSMLIVLLATAAMFLALAIFGKQSKVVAKSRAASPGTPRPPLDAATYEQARRQVQGPAIGLIVAGVANFVPLVVGAIAFLATIDTQVKTTKPTALVKPLPVSFVAETGSLTAAYSWGYPINPAGAVLAWQEMPYQPERNRMNMAVGTVMVLSFALILFSIPAGVLMILGGLKLRRLELYGLVMIAAIVALLPCTPGFVISMPIGIWALMVLLNPDVKAVFGQKPVVAEMIVEKKPPLADDVADKEALADPAGQTLGPGHALMFVGAISALFFGGLFVFCALGELRDWWTGIESFSPGKAHVVPTSLGFAFGLSAAMTIVLGGFRMRERTSYRWAMAASLLAMLPFSPACLLGVWIGGWSLLRLQSWQVCRAFDARRRVGNPPAGPAASIAKILALPALVVLAGVGIAALPRQGALPGLASLVRPEPVGTVLTYEFAPRQPSEELNWVDVLDYCNARVNTGPRKLAEVTQVNMDDPAVRVEIRVYGDDPVVANRIEERVTAPGTLELAVLAQIRTAGMPSDDALLARAASLPGAEVPAENVKSDDPSSKPLAVARWVPVLPRAEGQFKDPFGRDSSSYGLRRNAVGGLEVLILVDELNVTEQEMIQARVDPALRGGEPGLTLAFNSAGARKIQSLTSRPSYRPSGFDSRHLGLIVNGSLYTAPEIRDVVADQIRIAVSVQEAHDLAALVRSGRPPGKIKQVSRKDVSK